MNEILRRKMFNKVMNANQPAGILASSPEMVDTVQRRANGGSIATNTSPRRVIAGQQMMRQTGGIPTQLPTEIPVVDSGPNMFQRLFKARALKDARMFQGVPEGRRTVGDVVGTGILNAGIKTATTVPDIMSSLTPEGIEANRQERLRANEPLPTDTRATRLAKNISSSLEKVPSPIELVGAGIQGLTDAAQYAFGDTPYMPVTEGDPRYRPGTVPPSAAANMTADEDVVDDEQSYMTPVTVSEEIAATQTSEAGGADSTDKADKPKTSVLDKATALIEQRKANKAADSTTLAKTESAEAATSTVSNIIKVQSETDSTLSPKKKAEATDEALGIIPKGEEPTPKERMKARQALITEMLGADKAKDVRTDANYNLMMTGLMIAAGESPNALVNIAKGAAAGLKNYGEAVGDKADKKNKEERAIALQAIDEVRSEISAEKKQDYDSMVREAQNQFALNLQEKKDMNALSRLDRQLDSTEQLQLDQFRFKEKLADRTFEENVLLLGFKGEQAANLQQDAQNFKQEVIEFQTNADSESMKMVKAIQAAGNYGFEDAYAIYKSKSSSSTSTDEARRLASLLDMGLSPSQAFLFSGQGVSKALIDQLGVEGAQQKVAEMSNPPIDLSTPK